MNSNAFPKPWPTVDEVIHGAATPGWLIVMDHVSQRDGTLDHYYRLRTDGLGNLWVDHLWRGHPLDGRRWQDIEWFLTKARAVAEIRYQGGQRRWYAERVSAAVERQLVKATQP